MADLRVDEVIRDPLFTSSVTLIHRIESYDESGNPQYQDCAPFETMAVVSSDSKAIKRLPEALQREGTIIVRFAVEDVPANFVGAGYDRVLWRGRKFVVVDVSDWSQFGEIRMICNIEESSNGGY